MSTVLRPVIDCPPRDTGGGAPAQQIVEVSMAYQVLVDDDIVAATGTFTVTLPNIASATKEVTIACLVGAITIAGDATIQSPTMVTTGSSVTLFPAGGEWRHK